MSTFSNLEVNKRKLKCTTEDELKNFSKEELVTRVLQLERHNIQLKNIINKNTNDGRKKGKKNAKHLAQKAFDSSKANKRHILIKLYYLGWDYNGYATQEDTNKTIEHHLFHALKRTCLIEDRQSSNYHRCGRTDKGVSAFSQVVSIDVRSCLDTNNLMDSTSIEAELRYCYMINRILPPEIRCVSWAPVPSSDFSARFNCKQRTYKYFFPRGELDVDAMNEACTYLIGYNDYRNLCKMDVGNGVVSFVRHIWRAEIRLLSKEDCNIETGYDMLTFILSGKAFLWHQVRCIVAILVLVGQKKEEPSIVKDLLDISKNPW